MNELTRLANLKTVSSAEKLWTKVKANNLNFTKKQVTEFWKNRASVQVVRGTPVSSEMKKIKCWTGTIGCCQIDLMDISKYSGYNDKKKYLLNCIDVYSRYAWSFPVPNKKSATMVKHLEQVIKEYEKQCKTCLVTIYTDDGGEWEGAVDAFLKRNKIKRVETLHKQNMAIVERFNQTLWKTINVSFFAENDFRFIDDLPEIIDEYNKTINKGIKAVPKKAFTDKQYPDHVYDIEFDLTREDKGIPKDLLKPGDLVRRQINRKTFDKPSASSRYSGEVYKVIKKIGNRYQIQNVDNNNLLETLYLPRQLVKTQHSTSIPNASRRRVMQSEARVRRLNKREPSNQLDEGERRRLQPKQSKRSSRKPVRYRGDGISFFV